MIPAKQEKTKDFNNEALWGEGGGSEYHVSHLSLAYNIPYPVNTGGLHLQLISPNLLLKYPLPH